MGFFDLFKGADINDGLQEARAVNGAVLLDVRDADEYRQGHIPGSINIPLDQISGIGEVIKKNDTPIYAYCLRGSRSIKAVAALRKAGYTDVKSIGGINRYRGRIEKGSKGPLTFDEIALYDIVED